MPGLILNLSGFGQVLSFGETYPDPATNNINSKVPTVQEQSLNTPCILLKYAGSSRRGGGVVLTIPGLSALKMDLGFWSTLILS